MKKVLRYDKAEITRAEFSEEGFLIVDAIVTRTGVFVYRNPDGSLRKELRHPDDVFKQDSLETLKMLPITLFHPKEKIVDAGNSTRLSKGFTGETVTVDGKFIRLRLKITDSATVDAVLSGIQELSLGYGVIQIEDTGEYNNENYDFRQTDINYNHLAIVPAARAGSEARIHLDKDDAVQCVSCKKKDGCGKPKEGGCTCNDSMKILKDIVIKKDKKQNSSKTQKENRMKKIVIDGIEYEASPEVINHLNKEIARADKAETSLNSSTETNSAIQAKLDEASEKLKKLEDRDDAAEISKAVKSRLDLVAEATPHLDEETLKKVATMSDEEIRCAVIKKHFPEAKLDGKDAVYISARYDSAIELKIEKNDNTSQQRQTLNADGSTSNNNDNREEPDQDKSRKSMHDGLLNAWKKGSKSE